MLLLLQVELLINGTDVLWPWRLGTEQGLYSKLNRSCLKREQRMKYFGRSAFTNTTVSRKRAVNKADNSLVSRLVSVYEDCDFGGKTETDAHFVLVREAMDGIPYLSASTNFANACFSGVEARPYNQYLPPNTLMQFTFHRTRWNSQRGLSIVFCFDKQL